MWNLVIDAAFAMILVYVLLNIGGFVNGTIANQLTSALPAGGSYNNNINGVLKNTTSGYSTNVNMMNIAITIGIVITPISMLLIFRRMAT